MKAFFLTLLIITVNFKTDILIEEISIYCKFESKGYSTATASTHFKNLKNVNSLKKILNKIDLQKIQKIITSSRCKNHHQMKLGQNIIFASFNILGKEHDFLIMETVIIDLTEYKNYWIKNKNDRIWIKNFIIEFKQTI